MKLTPEKLVEKEVMAYAMEMGWFLTVVDSKAVFNAKAGRYISGMTKKGFPDLVGCDSMGNFLAIELKAKGRPLKGRPEQEKFIARTKELGAFGAVVNSAEILHELYLKYLSEKMI